jgi:hypothetical protein
LLPLCNKDSNLKPESGPEKRLIAAVANLDSQFPAKSARKRVLGKIGEATRCFVARRLDAVELNAFFISDKIGAIPCVEKIMWH